ncbi:MAG: helix-turn-helix domain-containing protein, partial [Thermoplasmata archaeon]|nr:helix-turn-helix domain-containing protein [Thermoplasmata archaeon]
IHRSQDPSVSVEEDGDRHVVWTDTRDGNPEVYYVEVSPDNVPVTEAKRITHSLSSSLYPQVAVDGEGYVHIAWLEVSKTSCDLYYTVIADNGSMAREPMGVACLLEGVGGEQTLSSFSRYSLGDGTPAERLKPFLDVDDEDVVHMFAPFSRNGTFQIYYCRVSDNYMTSDLILPMERGDIAFVSAERDDETYHLCWEGRGREVTLWYSAFSTEDKDMAPELALTCVPSGNRIHSTVSILGEGQTMVAWAVEPLYDRTDSRVIEGVMIEGNEVVMENVLTFKPSYPSELTSHRTDDGVCLVWSDERVGPTNTELVYAVFDSSMMPADGRHLTSHIGESRSPALTTHEGMPVVVWEDSRNGNFEIYLTNKGPSNNEPAAQIEGDEGGIPILPLAGPALVPGAGIGILVFLAYVAKHKELLLLIPAYSRLSNEEIVHNPTRSAILKYIEDSPGANFSHIMKKLEMKNGVLSHHLRTLERAGYVRSKKDGSLRRYYPANCAIPMSLEEKLLYALAQNPGVSETELAKIMGVTRQVVNYHVLKLSNKRKVAVRREGKSTKCYALSLTPT